MLTFMVTMLLLITGLAVLIATSRTIDRVMTYLVSSMGRRVLTPKTHITLTDRERKFIPLFIIPAKIILFIILVALVLITLIVDWDTE